MHDRWTFFKILIYFLVCGVFVFVLLLVTGENLHLIILYNYRVDHH